MLEANLTLKCKTELWVERLKIMTGEDFRDFTMTIDYGDFST